MSEITDDEIKRMRDDVKHFQRVSRGDCIRLLDEVERLRAELDRYSSPSAKRIVNEMEAIAADAGAEVERLRAENAAFVLLEKSYVTELEHCRSEKADRLDQLAKAVAALGETKALVGHQSSLGFGTIEQLFNRIVGIIDQTLKEIRGNG